MQAINLYLVGFKIILENSKHNNILKGLITSLDKIKEIMSSDDIIVYREENNKIDYFTNTSKTKYNISNLNILFQKYQKYVTSKKEYIDINLNDNSIKRITILNILMNQTTSYKMLIINSKLKSQEFINILKESFYVILDKTENYLEMKKLCEKDSLTNLENRLCYERKMDELKEKRNYIYILIDLFRLKYINDNINHIAGDTYIKETANILKKYFPEYQELNNEQVMNKKILTGDNIYRIGGDEFVIVSTIKTKEEIEKNLTDAKEEVKNIDLNTKEKVTLAINYGIAEQKENKTILEVYNEADKNLSNDKREMYKKLNIDRRK